MKYLVQRCTVNQWQIRDCSLKFWNLCCECAAADVEDLRKSIYHHFHACRQPFSCSLLILLSNGKW